MTLESLYLNLRKDAKSKGSTFGQVWHEAHVDGYNLYIADTSFGDGPIFKITGNGKRAVFECPRGEWIPSTIKTSEEDLKWIIPIVEKADWNYRLEKLEKY